MHCNINFSIQDYQADVFIFINLTIKKNRYDLKNQNIIPITRLKYSVDMKKQLKRTAILIVFSYLPPNKTSVRTLIFNRFYNYNSKK